MHKGKPFETDRRLVIWSHPFFQRPWYPPKECLVTTAFWYGSLVPHPAPVTNLRCSLDAAALASFEVHFKSANIGAGADDVRFGVFCEINPSPGLAAWQFDVWINGVRQLPLATFRLWNHGGNWNVGESFNVNTPVGAPPVLWPVGVISCRARRYTDP